MTARYLRYELDDGSEVVFESVDASPVGPRGADSTVDDEGPLRKRFTGVVATAAQLLESVRDGLVDSDEVKLAFGVALSSDVGWFFAKGHAEGSISVTVTWRRASSTIAAGEGADEDTETVGGGEAGV